MLKTVNPGCSVAGSFRLRYRSRRKTESSLASKMLKGPQFYTMNFLSNAAIITTCVVFLNGAAFAQSGHSKESGRLRDGRAYRIDNAGVHIIDELAELEVTADDLRRQVVALQDEVEKLRGGCPSKGLITEKDLAPAKESAPVVTCPSSKPCPTVVCPQVACPETHCPVTALPEKSAYCGELTGALVGRANDLEQQLDREKQAAESRCSERVSAAETRCGRTVSGFDAAMGERAGVEDRLRGQIVQLEKELELSRSEIKKLQAQAGETKETKEAVVAAISSGAEVERKALGGGARQKLQQIQQLIMERKSLVEAARGRKAVSVSARPLVTKSGTALDTVRSRAMALMTPAEHEQFTNDLSEIEAILREDIQLLKRITKV